MEQYIIFVRLDVQLKQAVNNVYTGEGISENAFYPNNISILMPDKLRMIQASKLYYVIVKLLDQLFNEIIIIIVPLFKSYI